MKEIWSLEFEAILLVLSLVPILTIAIKLKLLYGRNFFRPDSGYYLFENRARTKGLASIQDDNDLVLFDQSKNRSMRFPNYYKTKYNKFSKIKDEKNYNWKGPYWSGDKTGFAFFYNGKNHLDIDDEKRENYLVVILPDNGGKFYIKDIKIQKDNKIRPVEFY